MSPRNRFYGFALLGSSLLWLAAFVVHWMAQNRVSMRLRSEIGDLTARVEKLDSRPASGDSTTVSADSSSAVSSSSVSFRDNGSFPFRVLGSGRLGDRWAYLDIRHVDGARRRYYCRVEDGVRGVQRMFSMIDADALDADYNLLVLEDERAYTSMPVPSGEPIVE